MTSNIKIDLPKFDGDISKWDGWRFQLAGVIEANALDTKSDAAIANTPPSDPGFNNAELAKANNLLGCLVVSLSGSALSTARAAADQTLQDVVKALDSEYSKQTASARSMALKSLLSAKPREKETCQDFLVRIENLVKERLKNNVTTDELMIAAASLGFPAKFLPCISSALSNPNLTFQQLRSHILEYEAALSSTSQPIHTESEEAMWNRAFAKGLGKGKTKGKKSVIKPDPKKGKGDADKDKNDQSNKKCYKCGKYGHLSYSCKEK